MRTFISTTIPPFLSMTHDSFYLFSLCMFLHPYSKIIQNPHFSLRIVLNQHQSRLQMAVSNNCTRFLRHAKSFNRCAIICAVNAIFWCITPIISALCVGWCCDRQRNSSFHNTWLWCKGNGLRPFVGECFFELKPNGFAVTFGWYANGLPFNAIIIGTNQRNATLAKYEFTADTNFLFGNGAGNVRKCIIRRRWCELR